MMKIVQNTLKFFDDNENIKENYRNMIKILEKYRWNCNAF